MKPNPLCRVYSLIVVMTDLWAWATKVGLCQLYPEQAHAGLAVLRCRRNLIQAQQARDSWKYILLWHVNEHRSCMRNSGIA